MTEQERINETLQRQIDAQNARIDTIATKVDIFIAESQQQREDMRRLWERQDAAQAKHDADIKEMNQRFYAKFDAMDAKIDSKFDKLSDQLHTMTITAVVGFGAITVAVVGLVVSMLK